jgi:hypothetical protein
MGFEYSYHIISLTPVHQATQSFPVSSNPPVMAIDFLGILEGTDRRHSLGGKQEQFDKLPTFTG